MKNIIFITFLLFLFSACQQEEKLSYNTHIRPIFNQKCLPCHGGVKKQGGFSLLFREDAMGEMESGQQAIVPGSHKKSELYKRLIHSDLDKRMPYREEALNQEEIDLIAQWIDEGAEWEDHWAYIAPAKQIPIPQIPNSKPYQNWAQNNIDNFIAEKLEKENFQPNERADVNTLLRRVSLDLIGLPPNEEQLNKYANNDSPEAFEAYVNELLDSPNFGERWATMWLDLSRYADSKGYEKDPYRNIWRYRDWVINAFNQDMPFDQFTIEQMAGDLLLNPSKDQLIATAFHRNSMTNTEGGTDDEEFRMTAVLDRLSTTFDVFQGVTIGCVQCHSHPYDPIRHKEYYELAAIFNNTKDADLNDEAPNIELYEEGEAEEIEKVIDYIANLDDTKVIDRTAELPIQIKQAVFPHLIPNQADDWQNVQFFKYGVTNWAVNILEGLKRKHYFKFENIDLTGVESIAYDYETRGNDAQLRLFLGSTEGEQIQDITFESTTKPNQKRGRGEVLTKSFPITPKDGKHNLYFELINTTGEVPDGFVEIYNIELKYSKDQSYNQQLKEKKDELIKLRKKADQTPILLAKSKDFHRKTYLFERGNFQLKGEEVQPNVPDIFPNMNNTDPDRLAFAKWLVSTDNPLTARVIVNRFWEQIFGTGIVETVEDFGTQGFKPTHPELLDYLANQFMHEHKWSIKSLLKEIVLSAAYQQSSKVIADKVERDPYNQWLSRGSRFRLSAEQIRDQALAVSGLLHDTLGGKSVMPLQPDGIWQVVYSGESWKTAEGKDKYRRGIYTYWRRTTPYPSMMAFDSPSREFCVSRRIRTNTPMQALVTLNDPVYLEAAEALAQRMAAKGKENIEQGISYGYRLALAQDPDKETLDVLTNLYRQSEQKLQQPVAVPISQKDGEFEIKDPMTVVANAIMNLDGFMMRE